MMSLVKVINIIKNAKEWDAMQIKYKDIINVVSKSAENLMVVKVVLINITNLNTQKFM